MLSITGLCVAYGHVEALRGIDLKARQGEITAIIGSNGAGKTSTLMAISGLAPITAGDIRLEGRSIARLPAHAINQGQASAIFCAALASIGACAAGAAILRRGQGTAQPGAPRPEPAAASS